MSELTHTQPPGCEELASTCQHLMKLLNEREQQIAAAQAEVEKWKGEASRWMEAGRQANGLLKAEEMVSADLQQQLAAAQERIAALEANERHWQEWAYHELQTHLAHIAHWQAECDRLQEEQAERIKELEAALKEARTTPATLRPHWESHWDRGSMEEV